MTKFLKKLLRFFAGRLFITCILILLQILFILFGLIYFVENFYIYYFVMAVISLLLVVSIVNDESNPSFKIAWIIPILVFPIFGAPLYLIFGRQNINHRIRKRFSKYQDSISSVTPQNKEVMAQLLYENPDIARQFRYVQNAAICPVYKGTKTEYLKSGEVYFERVLEELKKAERFIFLEYFIIDQGIMWDNILKILIDKAKAGVDIRVLYDDMGTIQLLPVSYPSFLQKQGIKVQLFNRFRPSLDSFLNYRDHRKLLIIDGNVGFTGGINLADEYINVKERHGHWKDNGVMIEGLAVSRLTIAFLQLWYFSERYKKDRSPLEYTQYLATKACEDDGFVQPLFDGPITNDLPGKYCYMNIINDAKKYVYISTPYLILDNEMVSALCIAAQSGVDVKIITPHIPDKKTVFMVTRSNYPTLLKAGVKIYEYTPGFIHAKSVISDDNICVVGTANFDFRSFYLHFENGILMYKSSCAKALREDFMETLEKCQEIDEGYLQKKNAFNRFFYRVIKLFSPLL